MRQESKSCSATGGAGLSATSGSHGQIRQFLRTPSLILIAIFLASGLFAAAQAGSVSFAHTLYLVRHGAYERNEKVSTEIGGDLTPLGIAEAHLVAARLRGLPVHFDSLTSSTMAGARETAEIIRESLPE